MTWLREMFLIPVRCYQWTLSPIMPPICRFQPTCSRYFVEAVQKKGILSGTLLGVRRLCRCHPLGGEGYDPVE
ncbi:MAG: membrane protein insertion efficiency factor YidD [Planctomycetes bacterium]|nr:membrane protein insertion efficiency factor YidD [Planctomycetota bacterium]